MWKWWLAPAPSQQVLGLPSTPASPPVGSAAPLLRPQAKLRWKVMKGQHESQSWQIRIVSDRTDLKNSGWLSERVNVGIPYLKQPHGSREEGACLDRLERRLVERCCGGNDARLVVVVLGPNGREWLLQAHDGATTERALHSLESEAGGHEIGTDVASDRVWGIASVLGSGVFFEKRE